MKFRDLENKEITYNCPNGCQYYWGDKFIVDVDKDHYCLINYNDSGSGYNPFDLECVDKEFVSAFMDNKFRKNVDYPRFGSVLQHDYNCEFRGKEIILIDKKEVDEYFKEKKDAQQGDRVVVHWWAFDREDDYTNREEVMTISDTDFIRHEGTFYKFEGRKE